MFKNYNILLKVIIEKIINKITTRRSAGFTMVELGVVLTIVAVGIGLLSMGNSLVYKYRLKTVMEDVGKLNRAYVNFKEIYKALPGDMFNATTAFGSTAPSGLAVQNGNGNGYIDNWYIPSNEPYTALQHLSLAGLIDGEYSGIAAVTSNIPNFLVSRYYSQGGLIFSSMNTLANTYAVWDGGYSSAAITNKYISMILFSIPTHVVQPAGAIRVADAQALDIIYDDGSPTTGSILSSEDGVVSWTAGNCINRATTPFSYVTAGTGSATYSPTNYACLMGFVIGDHNL